MKHAFGLPGQWRAVGIAVLSTVVLQLAIEEVAGHVSSPPLWGPSEGSALGTPGDVANGPIPVRQVVVQETTTTSQSVLRVATGNLGRPLIY